MFRSEQPRRNPLKDLSLWSLLFSNIVTIFFAVNENWSLSTIMLVYWFQNIIIGFFNFIRILQLKEFSTEGFTINGRQAQPTQGTKFFAAFFFLFHFGIFHLIYLIFLLTGIFTTSETFDKLNFDEVKYILLTILLFFINHLFSYLYNKPRDTKKQNLSDLMSYPYVRVIPMHLALTFDSFFGGALPLFLLLKTFVDAITHIIEHNILRRGEDQ